MRRKARAGEPVEFTLAYQPPLDWDFFLDFHRARALPGVERVVGDTYRRVARLGDLIGVVSVSRGQGDTLRIALRAVDAALISGLTPRLRRAFDLDADPAAIARHLSRDKQLKAIVARRPGLRVAGSVDAFEQAVRAILGQQISVVAARNLGGRLAARWGTPVPEVDDDALRYAFPTPVALAEVDVAALGMPGRRGAAVSTLARRMLADPAFLEREDSLEESIAKLTALPGFGPWTAHYIAMRAMREPDAFPASDLGLLRALVDARGRRPTPAELWLRAERWRPWRAYAAQYLWAHDALSARER